jgi:hypothetical protein
MRAERIKWSVDKDEVLTVLKAVGIKEEDVVAPGGPRAEH